MAEPEKEENMFDMFSGIDLDALNLSDDEEEPDAQSAPAPAPAKPANPEVLAFDAFVRAEGIDTLPVHYISTTFETAEFVEAFLTAVKDDYSETGRGEYDCIVIFPYSVSDDVWRSYFGAVSARVSRIRAAASHRVKKFKIATLQKIYFPEYRCAVVRVARMSEDAYKEWYGDTRSRQQAAISVNERLKGLL